MIDWGAIVSQAPSIAMALVFAWFALELVKSQRAHSSQVMTEWAERMKQRDQEFRDFLKERESTWQKFIGDLRQQQYDATARLAEEIKELARQVAANNTLIQVHDKETKTLGSDLLREVTKPRKDRE